MQNKKTYWCVWEQDATKQHQTQSRQYFEKTTQTSKFHKPKHILVDFLAEKNLQQKIEQKAECESSLNI